MTDQGIVSCAMFFKWIPTHPPSYSRFVIPVLVLNHPRHPAPRLGAEPVGEGGGIAGGDHGVAEGIVLLMSDDGAGGIDILRYVSIGIVSGRVHFAVLRDGEKPADATATLHRSVEVEAPHVVGGMQKVLCFHSR